MNTHHNNIIIATLTCVMFDNALSKILLLFANTIVLAYKLLLN